MVGTVPYCGDNAAIPDGKEVDRPDVTIEEGELR